MWLRSGLVGNLKVASSIPGSSQLSVEVSLSETTHPDCYDELTIALRGRLTVDV